MEKVRVTILVDGGAVQVVRQRLETGVREEDMKTHYVKIDPNGSAAARLVSTINATGGITRLSDGLIAPLSDLDWIDLGDAYMAACAELGLKPKFAK